MTPVKASILNTSNTNMNASQQEKLDLSIDYLSRDQITQIVGAKPIDVNIYRRAFVHSSISKIVDYHKKFNLKINDAYLESYEYLEFRGDQVFNLVATDYICEKYKTKSNGQDEGFLTKLRAKIICGKTCAEFAKKLGLNKHVLITGTINKSDAEGSNTEEKEKGKFINDHILEDVFEAFVGAIYLDLGIDTVRTFVNKLMATIDFDKLIAKNTNYKEILMQFTHANNYELPLYTLIKKEKIDGKHQFTSSMSLIKKNTADNTGIKKDIKDRPIDIQSVGFGPTIQESEQEACRKAICHYSAKNEDILEHYKHCKKIHLKDVKHMMYSGKAYKKEELDVNGIREDKNKQEKRVYNITFHKKVPEKIDASIFLD